MNLLLITLVLFLAIIATRFSSKSGLPALLLFLALGVGFSYFGIDFNNIELANDVATISLMIIIFYGGFATKWSMARKRAREAIALSSLGVVITGLVTGLFCYFLLDFDLLEAMLLGSVLSSTDFASVSNILVSKKLNLKDNTASLLELESGSNDPTAYTMTVIFLSLILGREVSVPILIIKQVSLALGLGFLLGYLFLKITEELFIDQDGIFSVFIATVMLGTYALTTSLGGNGYLAVYILGIYLGNHEFRKKRDVVFFYDGLSTIFQIAMFFLLGLLSEPIQVVRALPYGLVIMAFIFLLARPLAVYLIMKPFSTDKKQRLIISAAGLRGAAAIAFAIMAINSGVDLSIDIYHIVFTICIFSLLIQGFILPSLVDRMDMFDPNDSVLRTFNYYSDKTDLEFIQCRLGPRSKWIDKSLAQVHLPFDVIIAKIIRGRETIVPRGETILREGDILVLGGVAFFDPTGEDLLDIRLSDDHQWSGRRLRDITIPAGCLVIIIQKPSGDLVIPKGDIALEAGDRIVLSREKK